jgi:hypothetical protein
MLTYSSRKRSPPMTEEEAIIISGETTLFGYEPERMQLDGHWFLTIRGDGSDDAIIAARLNQLRKPIWTNPNSRHYEV